MNPLVTLASALACPLAIVTVSYGLACWLKPFRPCRRCHGLGRMTRSLGRGYRHCRRCYGEGGRLRAGRIAYNYLSAARREARR